MWIGQQGFGSCRGNMELFTITITGNVMGTGGSRRGNMALFTITITGNAMGTGGSAEHRL